MLWSVFGSLCASAGSVALLFALRAGDSSAIALTATYPAIAFFLGLLFLGDSFTLQGAAGVAFVCIGAALLTK